MRTEIIQNSPKKAEQLSIGSGTALALSEDEEAEVRFPVQEPATRERSEEKLSEAPDGVSCGEQRVT